MEKTTKAEEYFCAGYNCAQSVVAVFAQENGCPEDLSLRLATGFGGGMGRTQKTCGAVTGAYMALGLKYNTDPENADHRTLLNEKVKQFNTAFCERHKTTSCIELTGCDLSTEAGTSKFREKKIKKEVCTPCVVGAVQIVDSL